MLRPIKHSITLFFLIWAGWAHGQIHILSHQIQLKQDSAAAIIAVKQQTILINKGKQAIDRIIWLNWANAYANKHTDLARSIIENYNLNFHFTHKKNRGYVRVNKVMEDNKITLLNNLKSDIYSLKLKRSLKRGDTLNIYFDYVIKLPNAKFTGYGIDKQKNILLKNFYFQPVAANQMYSDKNIDDYPGHKTDFRINLKGFEPAKTIVSNLSQNNGWYTGVVKQPILLITSAKYDSLKVGNQQIIFPATQYAGFVNKVFFLNKMTNFFRYFLGHSDQKNILITEADYKNRKVYGLDLLPKFLNPYDQVMLWELAVLHQLSFKYCNEIQVDRRKYPWITDGIAAFLEYEYLKKYYPRQKLLGKLAQYKLVQYYYASQVKITEKYPWLYLNVARRNKDQALKTALDSLTNYNRNVTMPYKAALGIEMLKNSIGDSLFRKKIHHFIIKAKQQTVTDEDFFKSVALPPQEWFSDFVYTRKKYDYKLKSVKIQNDSLYLFIKNKSRAAIPITLYAIKNDSFVLKKPLPAVKHDTILAVKKIPGIDFIGYNYFNDYPELQLKNNYKRPGFHLFEKPVQIRPYQDFDNPLKTQIFVNPFFEYNYYDGIIAGAQIFNESLLYNHFNYTVTPGYGTKNKALTGSFSVSNTQYFDRPKLYALRYGFGFKYFHYNHDLVYRKYNPQVELKFRDPYLRNRKGTNIKLQYMYIDKDPAGSIIEESDRYSVLDLSISRYNVNVIKDFFYRSNVQVANKFGKVSAMVRYRFLSDKNRQWDFRIYAGKFLYNDTQTDYFSFALDRPTDYLFQYHYYGRSETSGIFHQQFVWAEGGFKTFFADQYANDFMISNNVNIGIWKWFNVYGDWAWLKNKKQAVHFYYDSGLRVNLVQDYFEVFFPVYSKLGWEIKEPDYLSRVRIVFTMDINGLLKMFKRGWY